MKAQLLFIGEVNANCQINYTRPSLYYSKLNSLIGKKITVLIDEYKEIKPTHRQWAYYYHAIIHNECMSSNAFASMKDNEIDHWFRKVLRTKTRVYFNPLKQREETELYIEDIKEYSPDEFAMYILEVIYLLNSEFDIFPKSTEEYKMNLQIRKT